jgi:hypothetical protein
MIGIALGLFPSTGKAQSLTELIAACGAGSETQMAWCRASALGIQAAQGALGLAASGGTDLPGSASTLGWRMKGSPRMAFSLRGSLTRAPFPALASSGGLPRGERNADFPALHVSGTLGVFDGFFVAPTVGGVGSLDLTASGYWVGAPRDVGFQDDAIGWGLGARLGILRESFSLPGVSLSAFHRWLGSSKLWDRMKGDPAEAEFDLRASSLRGVVGKDIQGIGIYGGAGWERYSGNAALVVSNQEGGAADSSASGKPRSDRFLFFFGGSMTYLALQISGEGGWAEGFDPGLGSSSVGGFDPSGGSVFGALSLRLTF